MTATPDIHLDLLDRIEIASPCPVRWEDMEGDDRTRHCSQCSLKVHNLSAMSREEAEALIASATSGERICARLYRRADGTVLTADCPVGLAAIARRARDKSVRFVVSVAAMVLVVIVTTLRAASAGWGEGRYNMDLQTLSGVDQLKRWLSLNGWLSPPGRGIQMLGVICPPAAPPTVPNGGGVVPAGESEGTP